MYTTASIIAKIANRRSRDIKALITQELHRQQAQGLAPRFQCEVLTIGLNRSKWMADPEMMNRTHLFMAEGLMTALIRSLRQYAGGRSEPTREQTIGWLRSDRRLEAITAWRTDRMLAGLPTESVSATTTVSHGISIGADPEFEVNYGGQFIAATNFFSGAGALGTDGASATGEIRPRFGQPETAFNSVAELIGRAWHAVSQRCAQNTNRWNANLVTLHGGSGLNVPLGGHLHFSGIDSCRNEMRDALDSLVTVRLNNKCNPVRVEARMRQYGRMPSEIRSQPHGWEFRSPCSWLANPVVAKGVLFAAYTIATKMAADRNFRFRTESDVVNEADESRRDAIREFYAYSVPGGIDAQDMFTEWGVRPAVVVPEPSAPVLHQVGYAIHDIGLREICEGTVARGNYDFRGRAAIGDSAAENIVWMHPQDILNGVWDRRNGIEVHSSSGWHVIGLRVAENTEPGTILLSSYLRGNVVLSQATIRSILSRLEESFIARQRNDLYALGFRS